MMAHQHEAGDGDIEVIVVGTEGSPATGSTGDELTESARRILDGALPPALRDDRFESPWPPDELMAAVASHRGRPVGYLGGTVDRSRLQLDGLVVEDVDAGPDITDRIAERLWEALAPAMGGSGATSIELWAHPARPWHGDLAARHGLSELRALHQLRCSLPVEVDVDPVASRSFRPGHDEEALLRVNNRAFASHPDQGGMTMTALTEAADQPWFDPDGIRLLDDPARPGFLAGFCWTKIHEPAIEGEPRLGEIYAIGIDPDHHGKGLGVPMTAAGLEWLFGRGLTTGMLYVEADNEPALRTYDSLGFRHHRTDRAWRRELAS